MPSLSAGCYCRKACGSNFWSGDHLPAGEKFPAQKPGSMAGMNVRPGLNTLPGMISAKNAAPWQAGLFGPGPNSLPGMISGQERGSMAGMNVRHRTQHPTDLRHGAMADYCDQSVGSLSQRCFLSLSINEASSWPLSLAAILAST
jgi:hypothetical protein